MNFFLAPSGQNTLFINKTQYTPQINVSGFQEELWLLALWFYTGMAMNTSLSGE